VRHFKVTFLYLAIALALGGCGLFGGSDGTDVAVAENVEAQPTVNSVQAVPAATATPAGDATSQPAAEAGAPLPTAVTLPTTAPTPEPTVDRSKPTTYIVQSGDVLGVIAERLDADIAELRRINNLDGNLIRVGQELTIPALDGTTETEPEPAAAAAAPASSSGSSSAAPVSCGSSASGHCVQPGESLLGIALKYDVSVDALRAANPGISGDLIRSGQVINLTGGSSAGTTTTTTTTTTTGSATADPAPTVGPINDADCKLRNPEFPFFHASDGLCYANPFNATSVPAASAATADGGDTTCDPGFFLWEDGLCYPIPGATVEATPGPTPTNPPPDPIYGRPPCRDGYVEIQATNICWPEPETTPTTPTPEPTSAASTTDCVGPYFVESNGRCFVTSPQGEDKLCTVVDNKPSCPSA